MARQARVKSESGIYHIMLRGINKQEIFHDEQDYKMFIKALSNAKKLSDFNIYAYCIMPNHIHLLIKENTESVSTVMKRIGCRYVYWYNLKYERVGHLFQDRFRSEPVENDEYFLAALRYIHQNPVKAGIVNRCSDYLFSSYNWYNKESILIDKTLVNSLMSVKDYQKFHNEREKKQFIDIDDTNKKRVSDEKAQKIFINITEGMDVTQFKKEKRGKKKEFVLKLKKEGLTNRQITELCGQSRSWVEAIK